MCNDNPEMCRFSTRCALVFWLVHSMVSLLFMMWHLVWGPQQFSILRVKSILFSPHKPSSLSQSFGAQNFGWRNCPIDQPAEDRIMQVLATCSYGLQRCTEILDGSGLILSKPDALKASELLVLHCKTYAWLGACFYSSHIMLFKLRPKHHYVYHQAMQIKYQQLNVWAFTTFAEESFLGKCKTIFCACHGATVNKRFYERYLLCLAMMVRRQSKLESGL